MNGSAPGTPAQSRVRGWLRLGASLGVLVGVLYLLDPQELYERIKRLDAAYVVLGLALSSLQFPLLAARWSYLSNRLEAPLGFSRALREYYLSVLLNQLLPLGIAGDALRAVRHSEALRGSAPASRVLLALVSDRASGQLAVWLVVLLLAPTWWSARLEGPSLGGVALLVVLAAASIGVLLSGKRRQSLRGFLRESGAIFFSPRSLAVHLPLSLALLLLHVAVFWSASRALGTELEPFQALRIAPLVLVATTLPAFFAGWGIREAAAAGLYHLSGLGSGDGVSASIVFGVVGLVSSTPGLFTLASSSAPRPTA